MNQAIFNEVKEKVDTILIPIGMLEAHGPHCALGTDILIPREFAKLLDETLGERLLIAPEIPYGHSYGLAPFSGTIDVSSEAFSLYVFEIGQQFIKQGFSKFIFLNGHGGNNPSLTTVAEKLSDLGAAILTINWFIDYREQIKEIAPSPGHAGEDETSLVLAINEQYADLSVEHVGHHEISVPSNVRAKNYGLKLYPNAYSGNAKAATKEKGDALFDRLTALMIQDIKNFWEMDI